jgi:hypothetical protein
MNALGRRARQMKNGYRHLAKLGRPMYPSSSSSSVAAAIAAEQAKARRMQAAKGKKK